MKIESHYSRSHPSSLYFAPVFPPESHSPKEVKMERCLVSLESHSIQQLENNAIVTNTCPGRWPTDRPTSSAGPTYLPILPFPLEKTRGNILREYLVYMKFLKEKLFSSEILVIRFRHLNVSAERIQSYTLKCLTYEIDTKC